VVQTGKYGQNLGELVISLDGDKLTVESYRLYPVDNTIVGDRAIADEIEKLKQTVTKVVFASRGYSIDQPLAIAPQDIPNTFTDIAASTILANLCTDAYRSATKADIGFSANGMMRSGLIRRKTGVQTVYFEGLCLSNPKAKRGYSRDSRPDCKQVVVGLVLDGEGFPKAHEIFAGNRSDPTTVADMLAVLQKRVGKTKDATVVVDRGMANPQNLATIRAAGYHWLVAASASKKESAL